MRIAKRVCACLLAAGICILCVSCINPILGKYMPRDWADYVWISEDPKMYFAGFPEVGTCGEIMINGKLEGFSIEIGYGFTATGQLFSDIFTYDGKTYTQIPYDGTHILFGCDIRYKPGEIVLTMYDDYGSYPSASDFTRVITLKQYPKAGLDLSAYGFDTDFLYEITAPPPAGS